MGNNLIFVIMLFSEVNSHVIFGNNLIFVIMLFSEVNSHVIFGNNLIFGNLIIFGYFTCVRDVNDCFKSP